MFRIAPLFALILILAAAVLAQPANSPAKGVDVSAADMAKATFAAHGGEKLAKMSTLVVRGQVDIVGPFNQAIPGAFSLAIAGNRYFFEMANLVQPLKQIYNGTDTYSSVPNFSLPPMTSLGLPLLAKVGTPGYTVSETNDAKKKHKGFRITTPDGFFTDFYPDEKTGQIKNYESAYQTGSGQTVTTSVDVDEFQTVDGVVVPKKYSQRIEFGAITAYANFKARDILVNSKLDDDVFAFPKQP